MAEELGVVKYDITNAAIKQMENEYMVLTVQGLDDEAGFKMVHEARMVVKNHRVAVEKKRVNLKAGALEYGRKVDSEAKRIIGLLEPIEAHLQTEEDKVTKEKERIRTQKILKEQERVAGIRAKIEGLRQLATIKPTMTAAAITSRMDNVADIIIDDETFMEFKEEAETIRNETWNKLRQLEKDRSEWEEEQAKAKAEAERLEKVRKEQEAEAAKLKIAHDKIDAEKAALEAEKAAEAQNKRQAEFEKQALENARIAAEKNAAEKILREAREAEEKARAEAAERSRKAALAPDKDKILTWAKELNGYLLETHPDFSSDEAKRILFDAEKTIDKAVSTAVKNAKEL